MNNFKSNRGVQPETLTWYCSTKPSTQVEIMAPGSKHMLAEGPKCSGGRKKSPRADGSWDSLWAARRVGEKRGQSKCWREKCAGSGGDREQSPGQRKRSYSTLSPLDECKNFIPLPLHTHCWRCWSMPLNGQPLVIFCGSPLTKIWWSFSFCNLRWDSKRHLFSFSTCKIIIPTMLFKLHYPFQEVLNSPPHARPPPPQLTPSLGPSFSPRPLIAK